MSISIGSGNITSAYADIYGTGSASSSKTEEVANKDYSNATEEELMDACKDFEAYFLEQVFKAMEATVDKNEDSKTSGVNVMDYFGDTLYQEIAERATEGEGIGIAKMLYEQMKRNYGIGVEQPIVDSTGDSGEQL